MKITEKCALKYGAKITSKTERLYMDTHMNEHKHTSLAALILPQSLQQLPNIVTHCSSSHVMRKLLKCFLSHLLPCHCLQ